MHEKTKRTAIFVSLGVSIVLLGIKFSAALSTGSTAILSDAMESIVNVVAAGFAAFSVWYARKPADADHPYGHDRINFFSAGFEGAMIIVAAVYIVFESIRKIIEGASPENLGFGIILTLATVVVNGITSTYLIRTGKAVRSVVLEADGRHLLTDCVTSSGVVVGLFLTKMTGLAVLDPIVAIAVALNIVIEGLKLMRLSWQGLMDARDPDVEKLIRSTLAEECGEHEVDFHHLTHRNSGNTTWVEVHLVFSPDETLFNAHHVATHLESRLKEALEGYSVITTHLEPFGDHYE